MRRIFAAGLLLVLSSAPLHAQRARRSSRPHKGIPCGRSYISANKVCHIAAAAPDTSADSTAHALVRSPLPPGTLPGNALATPAPRTGPPSTDLDALLRERDSLRIVVATLKQVCIERP